ncbi:hypothetical protein M426DRAFT_25853 [Hypoxylon sp. CI-4A]|nr:hypothetical protein M426DRAFT_25853 [Hypoxylon sp. CI-4A]
MAPTKILKSGANAPRTALPEYTAPKSTSSNAKAKANAQKKAKYWHRVETEICIKCTRATRPGKINCSVHSQQAQKRYYEKRRKGICTIAGCDVPASPRFTKCMRHLTLTRLAREKKKAEKANTKATEGKVCTNERDEKEAGMQKAEVAK